MKRFICRQDPRYHENAAKRIMSEILTHIPSDKHVLVFIFQDIKALTQSGPGVYYVTKKFPANSIVVRADVRNYFYRYRVINKRKRVQTFLIPRNIRL